MDSVVFLFKLFFGLILCTCKCWAGKNPDNLNILRVMKIRVPLQSFLDFFLITQVINSLIHHEIILTIFISLLQVFIVFSFFFFFLWGATSSATYRRLAALAFSIVIITFFFVGMALVIILMLGALFGLWFVIFVPFSRVFVTLAVTFFVCIISILFRLVYGFLVL